MKANYDCQSTDETVSGKAFDFLVYIISFNESVEIFRDQLRWHEKFCRDFITPCFYRIIIYEDFESLEMLVLPIQR